MADKFIWIDVQGEEKILQLLRVHEAQTGRRARDLVEDLSQFATRHLIATVPTHDEYLLRHVDRTAAEYRPGGPGGGGAWEAIAGIKAGTSLHPWYVEFGTGIYAGRGKIYPKYGSVLRLEKRPPEIDHRGRVVRYKFRRWVRGQQGQHYFYQTWREVELYAQERIYAI